jgi:hypothetical protein
MENPDSKRKKRTRSEYTDDDEVFTAIIIQARRGGNVDSLREIELKAVETIRSIVARKQQFSEAEKSTLEMALRRIEAGENRVEAVLSMNVTNLALISHIQDHEQTVSEDDIKDLKAWARAVAFLAGIAGIEHGGSKKKPKGVLVIVD